jgi:hypothetical protein
MVNVKDREKVVCVGPGLLGMVVLAAAGVWLVRHHMGATASGFELKAYGFSTNFEGMSADAIGTRLDGMKAAGATWVRYDLSWDNVQPASARSFNWSAYDTVTKAAVARGLRPLVIVDFTPVWARSAECKSTKFCAPGSDATMATFAAAAVKRYAPMGVHDWEIWNEPNLAGRWQPRADPVQYTTLLKTVYPAIKAADDEATVIAGATAPAATSNGDFRPDDFVSAMYEARAQGSFDALSIHPYTYPLTPSVSSPADAWGQMQAIHKMMVNNGDGSKLLWATEYGAPTNGPSDSSVPHVTEGVQAQMVDEAVRIFRSYSWSGPFLWYDYQDGGTSTVSIENFFGLVRADGSHKPSYDLFVQAAAKYH